MALKHIMFFLIIVVDITLVSCGTSIDIQYSKKYIADFSNNGFSKLITNDSQNWEVINEDGDDVLHLIRAGEFGKIRKPSSFAVFRDLDVTDFEFTLDAKCLEDTARHGRDIMVFFGYQDSLHFYYVHVSNQVHKYHNIIGLVDGKDRIPIANTLDDSTKARIIDYKWHKIKVNRNVKTGSIKVFVDDMQIPIHSILDSTLTHGSIGVGSFDDFGKFKNLDILYNPNN